MAVYTSINKKELEKFLDSYDIGDLINFEGIIEGVENTNYKIITSKNTFILTIFEKRVEEKDIPFFINLQKHLHNKDIRCPKPIEDKKNNFINKIKNKNCLIMSFLKGVMIKTPSENHCEQLGFELAKMHENTKDFDLKRNNSLHYLNFQEIFEKCKKSNAINTEIAKSKFNVKQINTYKDLFFSIQKELDYLKKYWPINLPKGIIHADLFKDNVFFLDDKLTGFIDFYFSCNDYYAYELAICINDWCFQNNVFQIKKCQSIIKGYQKIRILEKNEIESIPLLLRGAAVRFLLTRLHDKLFHTLDALVEAKDPLEYFFILRCHQNLQKNSEKIKYV